MRKSGYLLLVVVLAMLASRTTHSTIGFLLLVLCPLLVIDRILQTILASGKVRSWQWTPLPLLILTWTLVILIARAGAITGSEALSRGLLLAIPTWYFYGLCKTRLAFVGMIVLSLALIPLLATLHPLRTVPKRTPMALGLPYEEVTFQTADGLRLRGWLIPHPEARGNVICCHGHGRNRGHWIALWPMLHAMKLNVLAFDFRGHGESPGDTCTLGQWETEDVMAAEEFLRHRHPGKPGLLVGISMGASASLRSLPRIPWVQGVWSEGAHAHLGPVVENELILLPWLLRQPLLATYKTLAWLDCGVVVDRLNPAEAVGRSIVPVHVCHGEADAFVPLEEGRKLASACQGPCETWFVPGATHHNIRQRNAREYQERFQAWLEARLREAEAITPSAVPPS